MKPVAMEESWSKICTQWAHSLDLIPVKELNSLADGEFQVTLMLLFELTHSKSRQVFCCLFTQVPALEIHLQHTFSNISRT
jgi:hypothetical protein